MSDLEFPFRPANGGDASAMAELVNIAGDGLPLYIWGKLAKPGQTAWDVGLERARLGLGGFAFQHTVVREVDGAVAACLIGYPPADPSKPTSESPKPMSDSPKPPGDELPAPLAPLMELGELSASTWYLNVLATFPQFRGRGIGGELMKVAIERARASGVARMSLTMSDANVAARRLYESHGFYELARRAIVKEAWEHVGDNWILMAKDVAS